MHSSTAKSEKANMTILKEGQNCRPKDHVGRVAYLIDGGRPTPVDPNGPRFRRNCEWQPAGSLKFTEFPSDNLSNFSDSCEIHKLLQFSASGYERAIIWVSTASN